MVVYVNDLDNKSIEELKRLKEEILKEKRKYENEIMDALKDLEEKKMDHVRRKEYQDDLRDARFGSAQCDNSIRDIDEELKKRLV